MPFDSIAFVKRSSFLFVVLVSIAACPAFSRIAYAQESTPIPSAVLHPELVQQVTQRERSFARSMSDRDLAAFTRHLSPDAVFFNGTQLLVGREAVLAEWRGFFDGADATFSWEPVTVVVTGDGTLAHSSGPVKDQQGTVIAEFNSVWRREADGEWRVVFDKGAPVCRCGAQGKVP